MAKVIAPTPTWFDKTAEAAMLKRVEKAKVKARAIFNHKTVEEAVCNLFSRWMDEREYEDFTQYEAILKKVVEKQGAKFVKGTKRPFGLMCAIDEIHYHLTLTAAGYYSWKRLGFKIS